MTSSAVKIKDVCEFFRGLTYSKSDEVNFSKNAVLRATNIDLASNKLNLSEIKYISDAVDIREDKKVKVNDILICTASGSKSHLGKVAFIEEHLDMAFGGFMGVLRAKPNINPKFLFSFFKSDIFVKQVLGISDGANINNLKFSQFENLELTLPSLSAQKKIVERLDAIFAEIDKAIAATEANIKNAEALFQSYLGNVLNECKRKYTSVSLSTVCEFDKRQGMHKNLPYVGLEHIESCTAKFLGNFDVTQVSSTTFYFNEEHVLYGRLRPYLNKVLLPDFQGHCSTEIFPLKVKNGLTRNYFKFWLMSAGVNYLINKTSTGARMPRANMNEVLTFEFNLPPVDVQNQLVDELNFMNSKCESLKISYSLKKQQFNCLKIAMLNEVFNGSPLEV